MTFLMVALILPMAKDSESHWFSLAVVGEAVILSLGTPQPNPSGGVRGGEAVFASVWTPQLIPPGGLMAPDAVLPL